MTDLSQQQCHPLSGPPMADADVQQHLSQLPGWRSTGTSIEKTFSFGNFHETMAFANALAWIAHAQDHHPDLHLSFDRCTVRFGTHSVGGISVNDFICAARTEALYA